MRYQIDKFTPGFYTEQAVDRQRENMRRIIGNELIKKMERDKRFVVQWSERVEEDYDFDHDSFLGVGKRLSTTISIEPIEDSQYIYCDCDDYDYACVPEQPALLPIRYHADKDLFLEAGRRIVAYAAGLWPSQLTFAQVQLDIQNYKE